MEELGQIPTYLDGGRIEPGIDRRELTCGPAWRKPRKVPLLREREQGPLEPLHG